MSSGSEDDATPSWFSWFVSVSLEQNRVFARVSLEKNCSQQEVVPNTDANMSARLLRTGKCSALTYIL